MKKLLCALAVVAVVLASVQTAPAGIIVQNTAFNTLPNSSATSQTISGFALSGGSKLVVTAGGENINNVTSVTFAGQALTSIAPDPGQRLDAYIWYLDNPTATSGDIVVDYTGSSGGNKSSGISALSISGAASGFLDASSASGKDSGALTIDAGSLVVGSFTTNQNAGSLIDPVDPSTVIFSESVFSSGGANVAASYFIEPDPAARTSFGFTGGGAEPVAAAASFAVIPEPASALLLLSGVAGLLLIRRRR